MEQRDFDKKQQEFVLEQQRQALQEQQQQALQEQQQRALQEQQQQTLQEQQQQAFVNTAKEWISALEFLTSSCIKLSDPLPRAKTRDKTAISERCRGSRSSLRGQDPDSRLKLSPASFMVEVAVGGSVATFAGISTFY